MKIPLYSMSLFDMNDFTTNKYSYNPQEGCLPMCEVYIGKFLPVSSVVTQLQPFLPELCK